MDTLTTDPAKADAFAEKMVSILNGGALGVMASLGHRAGLFDTMAATGPGTSAEIAERAGLAERYVREWLGAMATGGFVEYDPAAERYRLPPEHAALLTRDAAPDNLASTAQFLGILGNVEDRILECFRAGGGVPYGEYRRFHEVMAEDSAQSVVSALPGSVLPLVPGLTDRLEAGIDVLDVGCGRGRALTWLASTYPDSRFTGYDLSEEAISWARRHAAERGLRNVRFEVRDVTELGDERRYDLVTAFDAIHDQAAPDRVLAGIRTALRPGGVFLSQDINGSSRVENNLDHPFAPFLYTISTMHCMSVSLAQDGAGLGTMWGVETAREMIAAAGFGSVTAHELEHDPLNVWFVCRGEDR